MKPLHLADYGSFYTGGRYHQAGNKSLLVDQMYVEYWIPEAVTRPYPLVLITGGGVSGAFYTATPDGRKSWAAYFTEQGFAVYICDQPARARSSLHPDIQGESWRIDVDFAQTRLTATPLTRKWPQANLQTQWPGEGVAGDPIFDQFLASMVPFLLDTTAMEALDRRAVAELLDRIGPAVIFTHSQSGAHGWAIADERPDLVKGIVAVEPSGPPNYDVAFLGAPDYFNESAKASRVWGVTNGPMRYDPPLAAPADLGLYLEDAADGPDLARCWVQPEPARTLVNLVGIPIVLVVAEASYHASYDHCTSRYLRQAGVAHDVMVLAELGIHGNGHMMMVEKNNLEIAAAIVTWLDRMGPLDVKR